MSIGPGTSVTDGYVATPSTDASFGLMGITVWPSCWKARNALFPNFRRSLDAPMTATVFIVPIIASRGRGPILHSPAEPKAGPRHTMTVGAAPRGRHAPPSLLADIPLRPRHPGDHRCRRSLLRGSRARDGRGPRLDHAAFQLRGALAEADPLLLVHGRRFCRTRRERIHGALRVRAVGRRRRAAHMGHGPPPDRERAWRLDRRRHRGHLLRLLHDGARSAARPAARVFHDSHHLVRDARDRARRTCTS